MKKMPLSLPLVFLWFATFFLSCKKEEIIALDQNLVKQYQVKSAFTGSTYPVFVVLPAGYNPDLKYETLYALDGDDITADNQKVYDLVGKTCQKKKRVDRKTKHHRGLHQFARAGRAVSGLHARAVHGQECADLWRFGKLCAVF